MAASMFTRGVFSNSGTIHHVQTFQKAMLAQAVKKTSRKKDQDSFSYNPHVSFRCPEDDPVNHRFEHIGMFYKYPEEMLKTSWFRSNLTQQFDTFCEPCIMIRKPAVQVIDLLKRHTYQSTTPKIAFYGENGTGKSVTLAHVIQFCRQQGWLIIHVHSPRSWTVYSAEQQMSSYRPERLDLMGKGAQWLRWFMFQNEEFLKDNKNWVTTKDYEWSSRHFTEKGTPIKDIIPMALDRTNYACDVIGAILREARIASFSLFKVCVAIDGVNAFFNNEVPTLPKNHTNWQTHKTIPKERNSLIHHMLKMMEPSWKNGVILTTLDKQCNPKDLQESSDHDYVLQPEGVKIMAPYLPIETKAYDNHELNCCVQYFLDRKWITNERGKSKEGVEQLKFLSGANPYLVESTCRTW